MKYNGCMDKFQNGLTVAVLLTDGEDLFDLKDLAHWTSDAKARVLLEQAVDKGIDKFAEFFCGSLGNDPLTKVERSAIKTYLAWEFGLGTQQERTDAEEDSG